MLDKLPELSEAAKNIKPGIYRHFKRGNYEVIGVGRNSLDYYEELVIYRSVGTNELWARPLANFLAVVERDGYNGPRFTYVGQN
jgi:hypothetical protein